MQQFLNELKTPAAQARVRAYEHIAMIGVIQAVLCAAAYLNGDTSTNWQVVAVAAISQGVLAALDSLYTYFKASGNVQAAAIVAAGRAEAAQRAPAAPKLDANLQAISAAANAVLQPPVQQAAPSPLVQDNPALSGPVEMTNTIPNIAIVKQQLPQ